MAITIGTAVWGGVNAPGASPSNYDISITPAPPGGSRLGGIAVGIVQMGTGGTSDLVTSVSYGITTGAVPLTRAPSPYGFATESAEAGGVYWYWAGDSAVFPTGAQTVRIARTGTTRMRAVIWPIYVATGQIMALDSGATGTHTGSGSANPAWSHASLAADVVAMLAIHSGNNTMTTTPATNWTRAAGNTTSEDATATGAGWAQRTLAAAGALAPGWTDAAAEDWRGSSIAFKETTPPLALAAAGTTTSGGAATLSTGGAPAALTATGQTISGGSVSLRRDPIGKAGHQLWMAADRLTGLADNDPVATAADQSGAGNQLTQATTADQPSFQTGELNGLPIIRLDGASDHLATTTFPTITAGVTCYWALKLNALTAEVLLWGQTAFDASVRLKAGIFPDGRLFLEIANGDANRIIRTSTVGAVPVGRAVSLIGTWDGGTDPAGIHLYVNGVNVDGATSSVGTFTPPPAGGAPVLLGAQAFYGQFLSADVGEVGIYDTEATASERAALVGYLDRWLPELLVASGQTVSGGTAALTAGIPAALAATGTTTSGGSATLGIAGPAAAPDAIIQQANLSGPVTRTWAPPGGLDPWLTADNPERPTILLVSFPIPSIPPGSGGPTAFQVETRRTAVAGAADPKVRLELWERGDYRATIAADVAVTSATSQVVTGTFNPAVLADPTGSGVELRVFAYGGTTTDLFRDSYGSL